MLQYTVKQRAMILGVHQLLCNIMCIVCSSVREEHESRTKKQSCAMHDAFSLLSTLRDPHQNGSAEKEPRNATLCNATRSDKVHSAIYRSKKLCIMLPISRLCCPWFALGYGSCEVILIRVCRHGMTPMYVSPLSRFFRSNL